MADEKGNSINSGSDDGAHHVNKYCIWHYNVLKFLFIFPDGGES